MSSATFHVDMDANYLINYNKPDEEIKTKLCDLPDEILQEIISNIPTNYAVQTSLLSKRWMNIWKGISKIELEEFGPPEKRRLFIQFMEKLLMVYRSSIIKDFSLIFEVGEEASKVSEWLRVFANPNNIEELKLDLGSVREPIVFPDHFFSSRTLTKLQLSMEQVFNIPSSINFQNLVSLTLRDVTFPNSASTEKLFHGCQFMKVLTLIDCKWPNVKAVYIVCPRLEKLTIREWKDDEEEQDQGVIPIVPAFFGRRQIVIIGNNLKEFSYDGDLINDYVSIFNATIDAHDQEENNMNGFPFVFNLIRILSNVKKLTLSDDALEVLSFLSNLIEYLPLFHQLVELCVGSASLIILNSLALKAILHRSPLLKQIVFLRGVSLDENNLSELDPLPACFTTHLKMIKIYNFCANEGEINAIKFLLKTTPLLDILKIFSNPYKFDSSDGIETLDKLYIEIMEYPRASEDFDLYLE